MRHFELLALLLGVVFISGCTGLTTTAGGRGLQIVSFAPDSSQISSGDQTVLIATVANGGEADATGIVAELFGINVGENEWSWGSGSDDYTQTVATLKRADLASNTPGDSYDFTWYLNSPSNLCVPNTYTPQLSLYYKYVTFSNALLRFVSYDYLKSLPSSQMSGVKQTAGVTQSGTTAGPLSVSYTTQSPFVVYSGGTNKFNLRIQVNNVDAGNTFDSTITYPPVPKTELYIVKVTITAASALDIDCKDSFLTGGTEKEGQIQLTNGKSKIIYCTVDAPADLGNLNDYSLAVKLEYGYTLSSSSSIKVLQVQQGCV